MPIRITCPSCSATLSVKDEFAGRAVKCPKCAGIIPPQEAPSTVSEPEAVATLPPPAPPEPKKAPPEPDDEPKKPAKTGGKITGKPSPSRSEADDRDEDDRPRKKRDEDDRDEEPRPKKKRQEDDRDAERAHERDEKEPPRERDDRDEERPRERDRDERDRRDDDDDRPRRRRRDDDDDDDDRPRRRRRRDDDDDDDRPARNRRQQQGGSGVGLVLALVVGSLLVCCAGGGYGIYWFTNRVKEEAEKIAEDIKKAEVNVPPVEVKSAELAKAYKDNAATANTKYKDKIVLVEGKLEDVMFMPDGAVYANLEGLPADAGKPLGTIVRCVVNKNDVSKVLNNSRGQAIKLKGKCAGHLSPFIDIMDATFEGSGTDSAPKLTASQLLLEHGRGAEAADTKYKDKAITITSAFVDSKDGDTSLLIVGASKKGMTKIKVTLPGDARKLIATIKPGDPIKTIKGEYSSSSDGVIYINRAWIVP